MSLKVQFLGPILVSLYTKPLSKVIDRRPFAKFHFYADDTQVFIHLTHKNAVQSFERLNRCLDDFEKWLSANQFKLILQSHIRIKIAGCLSGQLQNDYCFMWLGLCQYKG